MRVKFLLERKLPKRKDLNRMNRMKIRQGEVVWLLVYILIFGGVSESDGTD